MADTEELRRLVVHAADLLDNVDPAVSAKLMGNMTTDGGKRNDVWARTAQEIAAIAHAKAVLRMVAACMAVEGEEG